jgi:hypothetical protein
MLLFWVAAKTVDLVLQRVLERQVFTTAYQKLRWRWKAFLTRFDQISTEFQFSYRLDEPVERERLHTDISTTLSNCEVIAEERVGFNTIRTDGNEETLRTTAHYLDDEEYGLEITLTPDVGAIRSGGIGTTEAAPVNQITISTEFEFAFHRLESALINLSAFMRLLEKALSEQLPGSVSSGRFVISPLENDLTLDQWIEEQRFDVSVLLKSEDKSTSVEFFGDHALIESPYFEVDSETVDYIKATLLNYYL